MTEKEALKLALEALKYPLNQSHENFNVDMAELLAHRAITAIKEALAEQPAQQEPVKSGEGASATVTITLPAQRTWVGLTDEEVITMSRYDLEYAALIGEVERKLKEKNT